MRWSRNANRIGRSERTARWNVRGLAWAAGLMLCQTAWSDAPTPGTESRSGFEIRHAAARLVGGVYVLDAHIDYAFSPESLEAMDSGVPLTILLEVDVERDRAILNEMVVTVRSRHRIEKHSLSEQYMVTDLSTRRSRTYRSFEEMATDLGTVEGLPMLDRRLVDDGDHYTLRLRAKLDIEALPAPLRPLAYLTAPWRLSSDWYSWPLPH